MTSERYDVAIVGGGIAGCAAAVTAARRGWATLLVEERSVLGGTVVAGLQRFLCGLYGNDPRAPFTVLNAGLSTELLERLKESAGSDHRLRMGRVEVHGFEPSHLRGILDAWTSAEPTLHTRRGVRLVGVALRDQTVKRIRLRQGGVEAEVEVRALIDCSGEGVAGGLAGAAKVPGDAERQLAGYSFELDGLRQAETPLELAVPYTLRKAVERGMLPPEFRFTTFSSLPGGTRGICRLALGRDLMTEGSTSAFSWASQVHALLAESLETLADSRITAHSPCVLFRDGGALLGRYVLTETDVVEGRRFEDAALKCAWPIEFWHQERGPEYQYVTGGHYEIPVRCLRSAEVDNLFHAGRCLSATPRALASCRVAGACLASGEAAAMVVDGTLR